MDPMPHGYTNNSVTDGRSVVKSYLGADRAARQAREERALRALFGVLPVPELPSSVSGELTTAFVAGVPAQDAIVAGDARRVLHACGRLLVDLQSVDARLVLGNAGGAGSVLVHNDFGPNNVVMGVDLTEVRLLCDWEWVTVGDRYTDLGWAEFIVRYHHPESVSELSALFEGYGSKPDWAQRQVAMARRASAHRDFVASWQGQEAAHTWDRRLAAIASWHEAC